MLFKRASGYSIMLIYVHIHLNEIVNTNGVIAFLERL